MVDFAIILSRPRVHRLSNGTFELAARVQQKICNETIESRVKISHIFEGNFIFVRQPACIRASLRSYRAAHDNGCNPLPNFFSERTQPSRN